MNSTILPFSFEMFRNDPKCFETIEINKNLAQKITTSHLGSKNYAELKFTTLATT